MSKFYSILYEFLNYVEFVKFWGFLEFPGMLRQTFGNVFPNGSD